MNASQVVDLLKSAPGLCDREIADRLLGKNSPAQPVNGICRRLEASGLIVRVKETGASTRNYIAGELNVNRQPPPRKPAQSQLPTLPYEVTESLTKAGKLWAISAKRPRIAPEVADHWDHLIDEWAEDPGMPLVIRRSGPARGTVSNHIESGREIVWADNSPAQWAFDCALKGMKPTLENLRSQLDHHQIPFVFAASREKLARMKYQGVLAACGGGTARIGWKLCHVNDVSTGTRVSPEAESFDRLCEHFKRLMKPSNHFLVPKRWWGFGEIPEVVRAILEFDALSGQLPASPPLPPLS